MSGSWVELRVHGVSGTPPESMLDFDRVSQVAGNEFCGKFRRVDEQGNELRAADEHVVEAFHWGRFTSGSWSQALWLLLAPFGIVNAAQFTLEQPTTRLAQVCHAIAGAMLRLVGLTLTGLFVFGTAVITMDLWAWQRIGTTSTFPSRLLPAVAMLGPAALLAICYYLGRSRFVGTRDTSAVPPPSTVTLAGPSPPPAPGDALAPPRA